MTLDEAIKQCNDTAEQNEKTARRIGWQYEGTLLDRGAKECRRFAAEHRQLAEWLRELQKLREKHWDECKQIAQYDNDLRRTTIQAIRNNGRAVLTNMDNLDLQDENRELKRLLKAAMVDLTDAEDCSCCAFDSKQCPGVTGDCTFKWNYHDEAMELIGGEKE